MDKHKRYTLSLLCAAVAMLAFQRPGPQNLVMVSPDGDSTYIDTVLMSKSETKKISIGIAMGPGGEGTNLADLEPIVINDVTDATVFEIDFYNYYLMLNTYEDLTEAIEMQTTLEEDLGLQTMILDQDTQYALYTEMIRSKADFDRERNRLDSLGVGDYIDRNVWIYAKPKLY
jgi:hypothetical protein